MQRGQKKLSKAQKKALPKIKQYIPPPKPPALLIPDPLDGQGLARTLPAELVVVLRRLGKKDDVTRRKGLDELREGWVVDLQRPPSKTAVEGDTAAEGDEGSEELERELKETALLEAVPVWVSVRVLQASKPGLLIRGPATQPGKSAAIPLPSYRRYSTTRRAPRNTLHPDRHTRHARAFPATWYAKPRYPRLVARCCSGRRQERRRSRSQIVGDVFLRRRSK